MSHSTVRNINSSQLVISSPGNVPHLNHYCPITPTLLSPAAWLQHYISNSCVWSVTNYKAESQFKIQQRQKAGRADWWAAVVSPASYWLSSRAESIDSRFKRRGKKTIAMLVPWLNYGWWSRLWKSKACSKHLPCRTLQLKSLLPMRRCSETWSVHCIGKPSFPFCFGNPHLSHFLWIDTVETVAWIYYQNVSFWYCEAFFIKWNH